MIMLNAKDTHSFCFEKLQTSEHFVHVAYLPTGRRGAGGEGHCGFQVIGMIEWGHESKPTNIPGPKIDPQKIPCRISKP